LNGAGLGRRRRGPGSVLREASGSASSRSIKVCRSG
jgi:hypothetical protein